MISLQFLFNFSLISLRFLFICASISLHFLFNFSLISLRFLFIFSSFSLYFLSNFSDILREEMASLVRGIGGEFVLPAPGGDVIRYQPVSAS